MAETTNPITDIVGEAVKMAPLPSQKAFEEVEPRTHPGFDEPDKTGEGKPTGSGNNGTGIGIGGFHRDDKGNLFDPDMHAVDGEGNPVKNKDGSFRKNRGRKKGQSSGSEGSGGVDGNAAGVDKRTALEAGRATAQTIFTLGRALGGDEWAPMIDREKGIDEPAQMTDAWAGYYEAVGIKDMPPWMPVVIAMGTYALPRLQKPQTQSRLQQLKQWVFGKYVEYKYRQAEKKAQKEGEE